MKNNKTIPKEVKNIIKEIVLSRIALGLFSIVVLNIWYLYSTDNEYQQKIWYPLLGTVTLIFGIVIYLIDHKEKVKELKNYG